MAEFTLYTNPKSRGRTVRWACEELVEATGLTYDTQVLDYGSTMKAPEFLAINPMGKVPAITHNGVAVTEVAAILAYLGDAFPQAGLPRHPPARCAALISAGCSSWPARSNRPRPSVPSRSRSRPSARLRSVSAI